MNATPHEVLKRYWGYDAFRPLQEEIISSVLQGNDTLALLPTGGGKSICFQVPAMCMEGLCLVVTPLIALMTDQVENLKKRGIEAVEMHSGMHPRELDLAFEKCSDGRAKFLYLSPERLETRRFREKLRQMDVALLAVDEAHCISQWGYDFRPPYLKIADVRSIFPDVPVLALTATAVPRVIEDIQFRLEFRKKNVFSKSFVRSNLSYIVFEVEDKYKKLLRICRGAVGSGIVYVRNRKLTKELAEYLESEGISASFYHAGLEPAVRWKRQQEWMSNVKRIIVATNAFGMGIDKPEVRLVVHFDLPDTPEAYYQEAGRGGRDGKKSYAVLLFNEHDISNSRQRLELSWPEPEVVKQVYQALGNYLQLPVGSGRDVSFDFDFEKFCNTYQLMPIVTFSALRILERDGYITTNESWDNPSRIMMVCSKEDLYKYEVENSDADKILKMILRSYTGLFIDFTRISENEIARRCTIDSPKVKELLLRMQKLGILTYLPLKTCPQLVFNTDRLDVNDISLSKTYYTERKQQAFAMLESIIRYATNDEMCRSKKLVAYFGESKSKDCGVCDICLEKKKRGTEEDLIIEIENELRNILAHGPYSIVAIVGYLHRYSEIDVLRVIRMMTEDGLLSQKGDLISLYARENKK